MTGNQDRADAVRNRAGRRADVVRALDMMIDHALLAMAATPLEPGETLAIQRYMRAAESIAKTQRAIDAMAGADEEATVGSYTAEDDMVDDEDGNPEVMDRVHSELESNLDYLRAALARKRLEGWTVVRAEAPGPQGDASAA